MYNRSVIQCIKSNNAQSHTSIPLMKQEKFIFDMHIPKPVVFCKLFEDNQGCISFEEFRKLSQKKTCFYQVSSFTEIFTKGGYLETLYSYNRTKRVNFNTPLNEALFIYLQRKLSGW